MPNRILKESVCVSDDIDKLKWFEEVLFYRLIVNCDDFGRFYGQPAIIKSRLFPLKEDLTTKTVSGAIEKLASVGMIVLYKFEGKQYLYLPAWNCHQSVRAKCSKFPDPEKASDNLQADESTCKQMQADASRCTHMSPYSYSRIDIRESNAIIDSAELPGSSTPPEPPVVSLILNDKTEFDVYQADVDKWQELYPAVDVLCELRKMAGWCDANPKRRKTRGGVQKFITNWLAKEQDKGGNYRQPATPVKQTKAAELDDFYRMAADWAKGDQP